MIIPQYDLSQSSSSVCVKVRAPYSNFTEADWDTEGGVFLFHCQPYFLRLDFGTDFDQIGSKSSYDVDLGVYSFSLAKTFPGTEYKLQVPDTSGAGPENLPNSLKKENAGNRLSKKEDLIFEKACVELEGDSISSDETSSESDEDQNNADASLKCQAGYGFGNTLTGKLDSIDEVASGVFELSPLLLPEHRTLRRREIENVRIADNANHLRKSFLDEVRNAADMLGEDPLEKQCLGISLELDKIQLTREHKDILKDFRFRKLLLEGSQSKLCYITLLEILLGWAYDRRVSGGERHSESCWNIVRLSPTISCLLPHNESLSSVPSLTQCCEAFAQRVILYPLCRSLTVANACIQDVSQLLLNSNYSDSTLLPSPSTVNHEALLSIILDVYTCMGSNSGEAWYLINELFMRPCISWLHVNADQRVLRAIGEDLKHIKVNADMLPMYDMVMSVNGTGAEESEQMLMQGLKSLGLQEVQECDDRNESPEKKMLLCRVKETSSDSDDD
ncbi:protein SHQ1 homolog isoform X2 [Symsagittifera roscoffensis]|uniref:protein SHQ1 homolog isoform X2 n=1 Tax=Symsagittifera roscoffensis TaxID=84072 RepID=UPI00307CB619